MGAAEDRWKIREQGFEGRGCAMARERWWGHAARMSALHDGCRFEITAWVAGFAPHRTSGPLVPTWNGGGFAAGIGGDGLQLGESYGSERAPPSPGPGALPRRGV
jgi:hypothetical protein